jgi:hypothetical protein
VDHVSTQTLLYVIIGLAVAVWIIFRQVRAQPVNANSRLPVIFGIIGIIEFVSYLDKHHVSGVAYAALAGSLVVAAVFGAIRAATVHLWIQDGRPWRKGNWLTAILWVVSIAAHFGIDYLIDPHNPEGGLAGSTILLYLAVTYFVQGLIMTTRAQRLPGGGGGYGEGGQPGSATSGSF